MGKRDERLEKIERAIRDSLGPAGGEVRLQVTATRRALKVYVPNQAIGGRFLRKFGVNGDKVDEVVSRALNRLRQQMPLNA